MNILHSGSLLQHIFIFVALLMHWSSLHFSLPKKSKFLIHVFGFWGFNYIQPSTWYFHFLSNIIVKVHTFSTWSAYQDCTCCTYVYINFLIHVCVCLLFSFKIFFRHGFCNISVPKVQFLAIEIARNREGYNDGLRETYCKKKQPAS